MFRHLWRRWRGGLLASAVALSVTACAATRAAPPSAFDPDRHMRLEEVHPGLRGYGLTVFRGTEPEPFTVEVVSVERGFSPDKAVIWMRSPDERLQMSGAAQGMSGSPIFLWSGEQAERTPGEGGRMAGALAYVYTMGKGAYFGVQPIEQMLDVATRAQPPEAEARARASSPAGPMLQPYFDLARQTGLDKSQTWRLRAIAELTGHEPSAQRAPGADADARPLSDSMQPALPVMVGSSSLAAILQPLLEPHGLAARAAPPVLASQLPPPWIDADRVEIKPGSVLTVPLTFGPLEVAVLGTATEVLPDGAVLAFGHSWFAQGPIAVPMASGFVHYIQPRITVSAKLGGSVRVRGAMVRDEVPAVVGREGASFPTARATVHVRWPDSALNTDHEYRVVHHERLLPALIGSVAAGSLTADTEPPRRNTLGVRAEIRFEGGRTVRVDELIPQGNASRLLMALAPPVSSLINNGYEPVGVESMEVTIEVHEEVRAAQIVGVTQEPSIVRPGETLTLHVRLQPYQKPVQTRRLTLRVPRDVPDDRYVLTIGGAESYHRELLATRPHLGRVEDIGDLFESIQRVLSIRSDALYAVLRLKESRNLAIGRTELPHLPSSRMAMLAVESSTRATPYLRTIEVIEPTPWVIADQVRLPVQVQEEPNSEQ